MYDFNKYFILSKKQIKILKLNKNLKLISNLSFATKVLFQQQHKGLNLKI